MQFIKLRYGKDTLAFISLDTRWDVISCCIQKLLSRVADNMLSEGTVLEWESVYFAQLKENSLQSVNYSYQ